MRFFIHALAATLGLALVVQGAALDSSDLVIRDFNTCLSALTCCTDHLFPQPGLLTRGKRDLTADGSGQFVAPNRTSLNAACYPVYIEFFAPGPPHNVTAWYKIGSSFYRQTAVEWPEDRNPWVSSDVAVSTVWPQLTMGPGTLAFLQVEGYGEYYFFKSDEPFTVQPSDDPDCYNAGSTGDSAWGGFSGLGITTTYAPGVHNTFTPSNPPSTSIASPATTSPSFSNAVGSKSVIAAAVAGGVGGALGVVGLGLALYFWRKRRGGGRRRKGGLVVDADEPKPSHERTGGGGEGQGASAALNGEQSERVGAGQQVVPWTYVAGSGQAPFHLRGQMDDGDVVQERDSGMSFPAGIIPPGYADATAAAAATGGPGANRADYYQSLATSTGAGLSESDATSETAALSDVRRGDTKVARG